MPIKTCLSVWTLMRPDYAPPYEDVMRAAAECGFDAVDFPLLTEEHLDTYWTPAQIARIRALSKELGIGIAQVCMFQNLLGGLGSVREERVAEALQRLERGCKLARDLGAQMLNMISPSPDDIRVRTTATLPEYFYLNTPDMIVPGTQERDVDGWRFDAKFRMYFGEGFDWKAHWSRFVEAMHRAADIAARCGVRLTIENRNNTMTPHTDSMLRLFKAVNRPELGGTFNVSQAFLHREVLEWAAHKYGEHAFHVRACDADGLACYNLPIGSGIVDWPGLINGLQEEGYDGYISFEWLNDADAAEHVRASLALLQSMLR